jgi:hypothetical protein
MQKVAAIKAVGIGIVVLLLLASATIVFRFSFSESRHGSYSIAITKELRSDLYLYVVREEGGGATVPYRYRYYFWNKNVGLVDISAMTDRQAPFLIADSDAAEFRSQGDSVSVVFNGRIFNFSNLATFYVNDQPRFVAIALSARPAFTIP